MRGAKKKNERDGARETDVEGGARACLLLWWCDGLIDGPPRGFFLVGPGSHLGGSEGLRERGGRDHSKRPKRAMLGPLTTFIFI